MQKEEAKIASKTISVNGQTVLSFNADELLTLYEQKKHDALCKELHSILVFFVSNTYISANPQSEVREFLNAFLQSFFYLICRQDFAISPPYIETFVELNTTISNITAISDYRTTNVPLSVVLAQEHNFVKVLMLLNPNNSVQIDIKVLFDLNPALASKWYFNYSFSSNNASIVRFNNIKYALQNVNANLICQYYALHAGMFLPTGSAWDNDKLVKSKLNELISIDLQKSQSVNLPQGGKNKKKIAIASEKWFKGSAVYKSLSPLINSLKDDYELTIIDFNKNSNTDYSLFKEKIIVSIINNNFDTTPFKKSDFYTIIYPDVGMGVSSIVLSNVRIAPIQICMYGHPVSTYGSKIDYFIGGQEVEDIENATDNYSEKLVLIPGLAAQTIWPSYEKRGLYNPQEGKIFIACPWGAHKVNYPLLLNLRKIIDRANKHVVLRMLPGWGLNRNNDFVPFCKDIIDILGVEHVEFTADSEYNKYMEVIEASDFAIDSYPFGSFNSVVDALYLEKPFITYETHKCYGRFAAAMLRKLGAKDFITYSDEEYISKIVALINDPLKLSKARDEFKRHDVKNVLDNLTPHHYFKKAVDHLIENHENYSKNDNKNPIIIK